MKQFRTIVPDVHKLLVKQTALWGVFCNEDFVQPYSLSLLLIIYDHQKILNAENKMTDKLFVHFLIIILYEGVHRGWQLKARTIC